MVTPCFRAGVSVLYSFQQKPNKLERTIWMYPMLSGAVNEQAKRASFGWQTFNRNGCFNSGWIRGTGFSFHSGWLQWLAAMVLCPSISWTLLQMQPFCHIKHGCTFHAAMVAWPLPCSPAICTGSGFFHVSEMMWMCSSFPVFRLHSALSFLIPFLEVCFFHPASYFVFPHFPLLTCFLICLASVKPSKSHSNWNRSVSGDNGVSARRCQSVVEL